MRLVALLVLAAGCDAVFLDRRDNVDVVGDYSLTVTNRENGCMFENWQEDQTNVLEVAILQETNNVTATVGGTIGLLVEAIAGSKVFTGTVDEDTLELGLVGTQVHDSKDCMLTIDYAIRATLDGDLLSGELRSHARPLEMTAACEVRVGCTSLQIFYGQRQ